MKQRLKGSAVALMVAAGAVGGLTANIAAVPDAQAFGLGDVWGAAKKVGGVAKIGTGLVADSVDLAVEAKHGARKLTGEIVKGAGTVIKNTAQQANKALGINAKLDPRFKEGLRHIGGAARHVGSDIMTNVRRVENAKKRSARCVLTFERCIEFKPKGSAANSPVQPRPGWDRPVGSTGKKRVQATKVRSTVGWAVPQVGKPSAARAPVKGITRQDLGLKKSGRRPLGRDKSIWGRPVGQKPLKHGRGRQPLGNDKSIWGRPVGVKPQKGRHVHGKPLGNDKSIWGRPVGIKKKAGRGKAPRRTVLGITRDNLKSSRNKRSRFENRRNRRKNSNRRNRRR